MGDITKRCLPILLAMLVALVWFAGKSQAETFSAMVRLSFLPAEVPTGVALNNEETLFVVESNNKRVAVFRNDGQLLAYIRGFLQPVGVAVDGSGRVYVSDAGAGSVSVFSPNFELQGKLGRGDGEFVRPVGVAVNPAGDIYVVDSESAKVRVYGVDRQYKAQFGVSGSLAGQLRYPLATTIDRGTNEIVVVDLPIAQGQYGAYEGSRVQFFDATGKYLRGFGQNGPGEGQFIRAMGVAANHTGKIFVCDALKNIVSVYDRAGTYLETVDDATLSMRTPTNIAIGGASGRLFVGSVSGDRVDIFGIKAQHVVTTESGLGGSIIPGGATAVGHGSSLKLLVKPEAGYHVERLLVDGINVGALSEYLIPVVIADLKVRVEFGVDEHVVQIEAEGNGTVAPVGTVTVLQHADLDLEMTPAMGWLLDDVWVDGVSVGTQERYTLAAVTTNHTVKAVFARQQFVIMAGAGLRGSIYPSGPVTVNYGGEATFLITPQSGSRIAGVTVDGQRLGPLDSYTFSNVTAGHEILVTFMRDTYPIVASSTAGGSIQPSGTIEVDAGAGMGYLFVAQPGYHLSRILVDNSPVALVDRYLFTGVVGPHTIQVEFAKNHYSIVASSEGNGSVSPAGTVDAEYGDSRFFSFLPASGHHVAAVLLNGQVISSEESYTIKNIMANQTLAVIFAKDNKPPVALAGPDQTVGSGVITLNGTNSFDSDGAIREFFWEQLEGVAVTLSDPTQAVTSFMPLEIGVNGASLVFRLTVMDDSGVTSQDDCLVNLIRDYQPPVADAGPDQRVTAGSQVVLNGSGSYGRDGSSIVSYEWHQISGEGVELAGAQSAVASFTAPGNGATLAALSFRLVVTDSTGLKAESTCLVNVAAESILPIADAGPDQIVREGEAVYVNGSGSSAVSGVKAYLWKQLSGSPAVYLSGQTTANATFVAPLVDKDGTTHVYQLMVIDQAGLAASDSVSVRIYKALAEKDKPAPGNLNKNAKGKWITISIELPGRMSCENIDMSTIAVIRINGRAINPIVRTGPFEISDSNRNGIPELTVKFDREQMKSVLSTGTSILTVTGRLIDGSEFQQEFRIVLAD